MRFNIGTGVYRNYYIVLLVVTRFALIKFEKKYFSIVSGLAMQHIFIHNIGVPSILRSPHFYYERISSNSDL